VVAPLAHWLNERSDLQGAEVRVDYEGKVRFYS